MEEFHKGNRREGLKLQEEFVAEFREAYKDKEKWAKMALKNTACCGKFSADRTIQEYVDDIWHLDHVVIDEDELEY